MVRRTPELYLISVAAEMLEMHPQTLRKYERLGLVHPQRTLGSMRVYSEAELDRLRMIKTLVDEAGINLAGVRRLLAVADAARELRPMTSVRQGRRAEARFKRAFDDLLRLLGVGDDH